ncbi:cytochrome c oxidase assembly protein [Methyloversatilis sp. MC4-4]|uniref:cytochrome c oxidase assembly protein n=1 Tax=Methyloversatilis sp. MC4-4 TaxID=3132824 RepID=UPI003CF4C34F
MYLIRALLVAAWSPAALAHAEAARGAAGGVTEAVGALVLAAIWIAYLAGARRRHASRRAAACFHAGQLTVLLTAFGPLDVLAADSAALHMTQHMGFMLVAAPLWVLANPLPQFRALTRGHPAGLWRRLARIGHAPAAWAVLHGATLWLWHAPGPYRLALADPWWHLFEHASFLVTAAFFWAATLHAYPPARGAALVAVAATLMHTGLLGALLTLAPFPLYGRGSTEDQQLAGLLMWGPGGLFYLAAGAWITLRWLATRQVPLRG